MKLDKLMSTLEIMLLNSINLLIGYSV